MTWKTTAAALGSTIQRTIESVNEIVEHTDILSKWLQRNLHRFPPNDISKLETMLGKVNSAMEKWRLIAGVTEETLKVIAKRVHNA